MTTETYSAATDSSKSTGPVILLLALAAFASSSTFRICDALLTVFANEFDIRTAQASTTVMYFAIAYGVMQFFYGPVSDRFGKFRVLSFATFGCAIGSLIVTTGSTFKWIEIGRLFSGATAAGIIPLSMAWIGDHVPYERRQATLAKFMLGSITGLAAGQLMGGIFADTIGWRWAFVMMTVVYLLVGTLLITKRNAVPEHVLVTKQKFSLIAPMQQVLSIGWARFVLLTVLLEGALVFGPLAFVPAYLHEHHGLSVAWAGMIGGMFAIGAAAYALRANILVSRLGERKLTLYGGALLGFASALYWLTSAWYWGVAASILSGFGYYLLHAVLQTNATQMAPAVRGTAVSLFASCLFLGQSLGVIGAAWLVDMFGLWSVFPVGMVTLPLLGFWFAWRLQHRQGS